MRYRAQRPTRHERTLYKPGAYVPLDEPLTKEQRRLVDVGVLAEEPDEEPAAPADPEPDPEA